MKVFEYLSEYPALYGYKMTDESRQLAEENYRLFLCMFNKYKRRYRTIIDGDDFEENIDIFYLSYCRQCYIYTIKQENKNKLSTYLDMSFRSICENAIRHYNTGYMRKWRDNGSIPLDKMTDSESCIGELVADGHVNIAAQYETTEFLNRILDYVDRQIQTTKQRKHFNCSGWRILKEWYTNSFDNTSQFLACLKSEGLACEDTTTIQIHKILSYYRKQLKGAIERGEV